MDVQGANTDIVGLKAIAVIQHAPQPAFSRARDTLRQVSRMVVNDSTVKAVGTGIDNRIRTLAAIPWLGKASRIDQENAMGLFIKSPVGMAEECGLALLLLGKINQV